MACVHEMLLAIIIVIMWTKFVENDNVQYLGKTSWCSVIYTHHRDSGYCFKYLTFHFLAVSASSWLWGKYWDYFTFMHLVLLMKVISTCFSSFSCLSLLNLIWKCKWGGGWCEVSWICGLTFLWYCFWKNEFFEISFESVAFIFRGKRCGAYCDELFCFCFASFYYFVMD